MYLQVIELSRQQEVTKQQEQKAKEAQYQAQAQQAAIVSSSWTPRLWLSTLIFVPARIDEYSLFMKASNSNVICYGCVGAGEGALGGAAEGYAG